MPGPPPGSEEEKVIINGGVAAGVLEEVCNLIYRRVEGGEGFENVKELVKMANKIEDDVFRFQRKVLEGIGFRGPWPHALDFKD